MQKLLKWFTPVLALGVAIFIIFFLISINSQEDVIEEEALVHEALVVPKESKKAWLEHFSNTERLGYSYPVNEVYIEVDLDEKITNSVIHKLSASILDPYQLFCLKEELKQHKFKYYMKKDKLNLELLIYSKDIDKLNSLVKVLKNYQISAKVVPYKEEI